MQRSLNSQKSMGASSPVDVHSGEIRGVPRVGAPGRLVILAWSLAMAVAVPGRMAIAAALLALAINAGIYHASARRLLRWRWLLFVGLLVGPSLLWAGPADALILGLPYSTVGAWNGLRMVCRAALIVVAVDGLSSSVGITELAGLLDRLGIQGLGFSVGVAVNLLPTLHRSGRAAWYALRMRGGLRRQWWRGLRLLLVTVAANALRWGDEIALVAEARAFSPARSQRPPIQRGAYDGYLALVLALSWLSVLLLG